MDGLQFIKYPINSNDTIESIAVNIEIDAENLLDSLNHSIKTLNLDCSLDFITPKRLSITITQK